MKIYALLKVIFSILIIIYYFLTLFFFKYIFINIGIFEKLEILYFLTFLKKMYYEAIFAVVTQFKLRRKKEVRSNHFLDLVILKINI